MAIEWDNRSKAEEVVVEHFHSPTVEFISFLSSLLNSGKENEHSTLYNHLYKELDPKSVEFLSYWNSRTDWSFTYLFNFFLPYPYFHDVEVFIKEVSTSNDRDFLYHFFGESISGSLLEELIKNPEILMSKEATIWWETTEQKTTVIEILKNLPSFRKNLSSLLINVYQSETFQDELKKRSKVAQQTIDKVKSMEMEPLALAQYIMGKTFRRISAYQIYYFIPSYFFSKSRMRIFDSNSCIVIYGVDAPIIDYREKSAELELQLKALSDRNRLMILRMLSTNKEYGAKIAEYLGITTATVSHHLELLKKAGLVKEEKVGNIKYFSYDHEHGEKILQQLQEFITSK